MCIISGRPQKISDTQILVFPTQDISTQVTVYSNKVALHAPSVLLPALPTPAQPWWHKVARLGRGRTADQGPPAPPISTNPEPVAMILPFPQGDCEMIDTSKCDELFTTLDSWFPQPKARQALYRSHLVPQSRSLSMLEVKRCGSYQYSMVPTLADFERVDESVFKLDANVAELLASTYHSDYSFLVCIIDKSAKYQPIAYRHRLRALPNGGHQLFIPTMHEHGNGRADWDHAVYVIGSDQGGQAAFRDCDDLAAKVPQALGEYLPTRISRELFRKHEIRGHYPNEDMVVLLPTVPAAA